MTKRRKLGVALALASIVCPDDLLVGRPAPGRPPRSLRDLSAPRISFPRWSVAGILWRAGVLLLLS